MAHAGQIGIGADMPGGSLRLKYGNPLFMVDVAADFPDMRLAEFDTLAIRPEAKPAIIKENAATSLTLR